MDEYKNKPIYRGIDLLKFTAAILILLLHVPPAREGSAAHIFIRQILTVTAVPFFFAASGFFAVEKLKGTFREKAFSTIKKPYVLYLKWSVIYLPLSLYALKNLDAVHIAITYIRNFFLEGSYLTIWYLNALAFAFLFYFLLLKKLSPLKCVLLTVPLYVIGCLLSSYNELLVSFPLGQEISGGYYTVFETTKNGLFFGLPFVSIGGLVVANGSKSDSKGTAVAGMCLSGVLIVAEVLLRNAYLPNSKSVDFVIFLLPFTVFALKFASRIDLNAKYVMFCGKKTDLYMIFRNLSVLIFLTQRIFIFAADTVAKILYKYLSIGWLYDFPVLNFIAVSVSTVLFSLLLMILSTRFKWIRKLY